MTSAITTERLTKRFGARVVLSNIDLQVAAGECVRLCGAHGSGRTTLLRMLATLVPPSSGRIEIDGLDAVRRIYEVRSRVMFVGADVGQSGGLRVREHVEFVASARGSAANRASVVDEVLSRAGLSPEALVDELPISDRRRVALATAFLVAPPVLLLDEPLRLIDTTSRSIWVEWLREVNAAGTTVVVATEDDSADRAICHRAVRLDAGRLAAHSAPAEPRVIPAAALAAGSRGWR